MSRILVIGDIHGCLNKLEQLMKKLTWNPKEDTLVFIGDYIDRGPDSAGVIEYILGLKAQSDKIICLMGNHESLFLDYLAGINTDVFLINGGYDTLLSYNEDEKNIPESHLEFLNNLKPYYETKDYIFVHAGLRDGIALKDQSLKDLLWIREAFIKSDYDHGRRVIFGHTPLPRPLCLDTKIGIDTGAVFEGDLTCLELPDTVFCFA